MSLLDAFFDVLALNVRDPSNEKLPPKHRWPEYKEYCLFEGTASELLEMIALGTPDELPADAARLSKALNGIGAKNEGVWSYCR